MDSKIESRHGVSDYFQVPGVVGAMELEVHMLESLGISVVSGDEETVLEELVI